MNDKKPHDNQQSLNDDTLMSDHENKRLLSEYAHIRTRQEAAAPDLEAAWMRFEQRRKTTETRKARQISIIRYSAAAAIVLCAVVSAAYLFIVNDRDSKDTGVKQQYAECNVGENGLIKAFEATNGPRVVMIGDANQNIKPVGKQVFDDQMEIDDEMAVVKPIPMAKVLDTAKKTITTPRGATYDIVLSDGTEVKLNADSKITFPVHFNGSERIVELEGEAFFSVVRDEDHPFIVKSTHASTTVLGTEFDVKAYADMPTSVVLKSGKVMVHSNMKGEDGVTLLPNQMATIKKDGVVSLVNANAENLTMWTSGKFCFDTTPLLTLAKDMGRWYNVNIEIADEMLSSNPISFEISRECGLAEFIEKLNSLSFLNVTLEENNVIICRKGNSIPAIKLIKSPVDDN
ncbi:MAG: FecR family protein [Prevotella sp.]